MFTHADVVAAGRIEAQISPNYKKSLDLLDNVVRDCIMVSNQYGGIPAPTSQHFYASVLFTALISRGVSLAILAPRSPWSKKLIEHWDYASVASLARTMMELRAAFHYLCVDKCSREEWECRWNLLNLHDCTSRIRLFSESPRSESRQLEGFRAQAEELRERLKSNAFFLTMRHQAKLLNGQTTYLYSIEDMLEKAGVEKGTYRYLNILFSSAVHGLPMSYYRMADQERGRGLPSPVERHYTAMSLSFAASLLAATRYDVESLFKEAAAARPRGPA